MRGEGERVQSQGQGISCCSLSSHSLALGGHTGQMALALKPALRKGVEVKGRKRTLMLIMIKHHFHSGLQDGNLV